MMKTQSKHQWNDRKTVSHAAHETRELGRKKCGPAWVRLLPAQIKRIRTSGGRLVSPDNDCVGTYERKPIFCAWPSYIPTANSAVGMGIHGLGRSGVPAGGQLAADFSGQFLHS